MQVAVHICEYSQAVAKLGRERVHAAACYAPSADMVSALVAKSEELRDFSSSSAATCSMILMIQLREEMAPKKKSRTLSPETAAVRLAEHGLSPKACWWLNGNVVGVWQGLRRVRTLLNQKNSAAVEAWRRMADSAPLVPPSSVAELADSAPLVPPSSVAELGPRVAAAPVRSLGHVPVEASQFRSWRSPERRRGGPGVPRPDEEDGSDFTGSDSSTSSDSPDRDVFVLSDKRGSERDGERERSRERGRSMWKGDTATCRDCGGSYRRSCPGRHVLWCRQQAGGGLRQFSSTNGG